jgi:hypothetical protein
MWLDGGQRVRRGKERELERSQGKVRVLQGRE